MKRLLPILAAAALIAACNILAPEDKAPRTFERVMILYSAGFNNISSYLAGDIEDLREGYVPGRYSPEALVVISHQPVKYGDYSTPTSPVLFYMHSDPVLGVRCDTLYRAEQGALLTEPEVMREMLSKATDFFPAEHYTLVFSSHGTGWLPQSYYEKGYSSSYDFFSLRLGGRLEINDISAIPVKTIGQEMRSRNNGLECGIADFAQALPIHFDAVLLDACLMGGIETAWELREKTDLLGFSQTEILADGLDYPRLTKRLLEPSEADVIGACEDYFAVYDAKSGISRSATFSLVDCSQLEGLATACKSAFASCDLSKVNPSSVQRYYRYNCHWFYDLEDILVKAGAPEAKLTAVRDALNKAIVYKAATPQFMKTDNGFTISTYCGLSMYLPCNGDATLDAYYRNLAWNEATDLVKSK